MRSIAACLMRQMLSRIALAAIAGAIAGYWLRHRQEPEDDIDWLDASETVSLADILADLANKGELVEWDGETILQSVIED